MDEVITFANKGEATVYGTSETWQLHFLKSNLGKHGMPAGLFEIWNDCLRLGTDGESTFVACSIIML